MDIDWEIAQRELKRCLTEEKSRAHSALKLAQIKQKPNENLRIFILRYQDLHSAATGKTAAEDTDQVIKGLPFAFVYLDDVLIHSPDIETHLKHIRILFQRLREADLKLKDSKCNYFKTHVQYLGHLVSGNKIKPLPEKLESVKKMPAPTTPKEIKQFLGLVGYYRKFIPRFADIARPMTDLTKQDVPLNGPYNVRLHLKC